MLEKASELMKRAWPAGLVALSCGAVYCAILCFLGAALEVAEEFVAGTGEGGPYTLFLVNSLLLGWGVIAVLEHRLGVSGAIVWAIALPWWIVSIGGGFAVAGLVTVRLPDSTIDLIVLCAVTAGGTGALRTYFGDFE